MSFRLLQTTYSHIIGVCKHFYAVQSWHMLFWLLKDAWSGCNRCSLSVLPTPFWSPIRHLLQTSWQPADWLPVTNLLSTRVFLICRWFVWNYAMVFQNLICLFNVSKWKGLCIRWWWQNRQLSVWPCFCWMNHFGSSVNAIWKASTHWTKDPFFCRPVGGSACGGGSA